MDDIKVIRGVPSRSAAVYEESKDDRAHAAEAAALIGQSFVWEDTAEGGDFWSDVCDRLCQIARNGRIK